MDEYCEKFLQVEMAAGRNIDDWEVLMKLWNELRCDIHLALEKGTTSNWMT